MQPLLPGQGIEVTVEKGVYRGLGLARHDGQVVFIPRGLPGERLRVRVESVPRGYARARLVEVLEPAAGRRASPCPLFHRCGGCAYQELDYPSQLALKEAILRESLARAGVEWPGEILVHGSPEEGWRTRAFLHLEVRGQELRLGLREERSHRLVPLGRCLQLAPGIDAVARSLHEALSHHLHLARRIWGMALAESLQGGNVVASFETDLSSTEVGALAALAPQSPWLTGLGAVVGPEERRRFVLLRGEPYVEARVHGKRLRSHVLAFFQANRFLLEDLVSAVGELTPPGGRLLDLYAGGGLFALTVGERAEEVIAVEGEPLAVEDARVNAVAAGLAHVQWICADVLEGLERSPAVPGERVILDPPRAGAGREVVQALAAREPEAIVYVSCDPTTLARDLKTFAELGYHSAAVHAFDLFPDTFHIETVVKLARRPADSAL